MPKGFVVNAHRIDPYKNYKAVTFALLAIQQISLIYFELDIFIFHYPSNEITKGTLNPNHVAAIHLHHE